MKKIVKIVIIGLLILLLIISLGGLIMVNNSMDYNTTEMEFTQISEEVRVYRDEKGIPTIIAKNTLDLFFAQGYEMARDRLFQMEFMRSVGTGELSELIGNSTLSADIYLRSLGIGSNAKEKYSLLEQEHKDILNIFADGVNSYVDDHHNSLPLEFLLLGAKPSVWTAVDILAIQGVLARQFSIRALNRELVRYDLAVAVGAEKAVELFPITDDDALEYYLNYDFDNNKDAVSNIAVQSSISPIIELFGSHYDYGSNSWVVSGNNTISGNPILANDPHLDMTMPSVWWEVQLVSPDYHLQGFTFPGIPGIITGHNDYVSWGITNVGTDTVDLFFFNTNDNDQYYIDGQWKDFTIENLDIEIKGEDNFQYELRKTEYGPVLDPVIFGVPDLEDTVYAMRWTLLDLDNPYEFTAKAFFNLFLSKNADDVHESLRYFGSPGQNFVYATMDGDIGYQLTGDIPIRKTNGAGIIPQNGSSGEGWIGYVPYEDHYQVRNPEKGFFGTANQQIDPRNEYYITDSYTEYFRGERINDVLSSNRSMTVDNLKNLQYDTYNRYADLLLDDWGLDTLNSAITDDQIFTDAVEILNNWNRKMKRESVGAMIFATMRVYFAKQTFSDELDQTDFTYASYDRLSTKALVEFINDTDNHWFDDSETDEIETGEDMIIRALNDTITYLSDKFGDDMEDWTYDKLHIILLEHPLGSQLAFLNEGNQPTDGSSYTVNFGGGPSWGGTEPNFVQIAGASNRIIVEMEDTWSNIWTIVVPGESGHYSYEHKDDGFEDWTENRYHRVEFVTEMDGEADFTYKPI